MSKEATSENGNWYERFVLWITSAISYCTPFLTTVPNLTWWTGAMAIPLFLYIYVILVGYVNYGTPLPSTSNPAILATIISVVATLEFLVWSIVVLHRNKESGLVTCGPYKYVRHPQYLAFIVLTGTITYQSIWIAHHTLFGILFIHAEDLENLWLLMILMYVVIMFLEEKFLDKQFGSEWTEYRDEVSFIIPFGNYKLPLFLEYFLACAIPYSILKILLILTA